MRAACLFLVLAVPAVALAQALPAAAPSSPGAPKALVETRPMLTTRPTGDDIAKFYPALARLYEIGGDAMVSCGVRADGQGHDCRATSESPPGLGFGRAAEKLASTFRFAPGTVDGVAVERPWNTHIAFKLDEDPPTDAPESDLSPESLRLAEQYVREDGLMPIAVPAAAGAVARKDCAANGGGACDQFGKAAEAAAAEESARLQAAVVAWVARTYTEAELRALASPTPVRDPDLIDKAGAFAMALPRIEARAGRDHHVLIRKHYCEIVGCPSLTAQPASKPAS